VRRGPSRVSILRAVVAAAVRNNTLRGVARDIGLSAPAVQNFIDGAEPRPSTIQKLEGWYVRHLAGSGDELGRETAEAAVRMLVRDLPLEHRTGAMADLLDRAAAHYSARVGTVPLWLEQARGYARDASTG
jgi:hypothetical protein